MIKPPSIVDPRADRSDECEAAIAAALQELVEQAAGQGWIKAEILLAIAEFSRHGLVMLVKANGSGAQADTR